MPKIMIVEDDSAIREELALLLRNEGCQTAAVTDFSDVPKQVGEEAPDLILLDLGLPGRDGMALCADIRKKYRTPIIFVTSRDSASDELRALSLGGDDYITKPYNIPVLLARIRAVLRRSGGTGRFGGGRAHPPPDPGDGLGGGPLRGAHPERAENIGPPHGPSGKNRLPGRPD